MNYNINRFISSDPLKEMNAMAPGTKRMTFALTPDMESRLDRVKGAMFCNCSRSEMIRTLIITALDAIRTENDNPNEKQGKST